MTVRQLFTTRRGPGQGTSLPPYDGMNLGDHVGDDPAAVAANRAALAGALGVDRDRLVFMQQVHGTRVTVVDAPVEVAVPDTDALVTARPGLALAVLVADCVPLLLADEGAGVIGAVHAGRRGVAGDVVGAAVRAMRALGATEIAARLGPHIGACCYEVGRDVQDEVAAALPVTRSRTSWGTTSLDLAAGLVQQLDAAGVHEVSVDGACTAETPALFSYRRDAATGRFAGITALLP